MDSHRQSDFRILVLGAGGQLGQALMAESPNAIGATRADLDFSRSDELNDKFGALLKEISPVHAVINAAAYTAVDMAERDEDMAFRVNTVAPEILARVCKHQNLTFIHISTDYVFNGAATRPYQETDPTAPLNVYGKTKLMGEKAVLKAELSRFAVLRTSWVYDSSNRNFLTTMLRLGQERDVLRIVDDQTGRPTYTVDLARAAIGVAKSLALQPERSGLYHVTNTGEPVSWAGFAREIFQKTKVRTPITGISSDDYPTAAKRPFHSVLNTTKFETTFQHGLPEWRNGLDRALAKLS